MRCAAGDRLRHRVVEVAIAASAEAVARHVDRRAEAPAVEEIRERLALSPASTGAVTANPRSPSCSRSPSHGSASMRAASGA